MKRKIDITKQQLNCCGEILFEADHINFTYELWFDVDKYFGTNVENNGNAWINFYTNWYPDGTISATYDIDNQPESFESFNWELTEPEQKFFLNKMEEYCQMVYQASLQEMWEATQKGE